MNSLARRLPTCSTEVTVRLIRILYWPAAIVLGIVAESVAFSFDDPLLWVPDLIVGWVLIACGGLAWERKGSRGTGGLLAATGVTWFLGTVSPALLYIHRGPLVHLLLTYPGWRPRTRVDLIAVGAGYAAAIATPVWRNEIASIVLTLAFVTVAACGYVVAVGRTRPERLTALQAAAGGVAVALVGGTIARLAVETSDAANIALVAYEAMLCVVAIFLVVRLGGTKASALADLVVELGETQSGTLRGRLATVLGDPKMEIGYWAAEQGNYLDDAGSVLTIPEKGSTRSSTYVERDGRPFAVLVHDAAVLGDPTLVEAVATATRLSASNVALRAEVRSQVDELIASRRRLLVATDEERQRLEQRLREGPERRLASLSELLAQLPQHGADGANAHVEQAQSHLDATVEELHELARGLHPRQLVESGLRGALESNAQRAPVPVELDIRVGRLPDELEATVYFFCAEALANVAKYASASRVDLQVAARDGDLAVVVADDGVGGADSSGGTGLQGLADRVEALGGTFGVESQLGKGTRLTATLPLSTDEH